MGGLRRLVLRVKGVASLSAWYARVLGMEVVQGTEEVELGYPGPGVKLVFREAEDEGEERGDGKEGGGGGGPSVYWKIGLAVADVELARERILAAGVQVSQPKQFLQVGYLCHLADPRGFTIELLQHTLGRREEPLVAQAGKVLGQDVHIGQVTIRCTDAQATLRLYKDALGLKLLSIQEIPEYQFTLYFLACTPDVPPGPLESVGIREWLYQRPYTTLEIQARQGPVLPLHLGGEGVEVLEMWPPWPTIAAIQATGSTAQEGVITDRDGFRVKILQ